MAYKCIRACFNQRLYEKDEVYDSIGAADLQYFEKVDAGEDERVVETGLGDEPGSPDGDSGKTEREEIFDALEELEVEFKKNASTDSLKVLLMNAQNQAISS